MWMQCQEDLKKTNENGKENNRTRKKSGADRKKTRKLTENEGWKTKIDKYGCKVRKT